MKKFQKKKSEKVFYKTHPAMLFLFLRRLIWMLPVPVTKSTVLFMTERYEILKEYIWLDFLIVATGVCWAVLQWNFLRYRQGREGVELHRGVIFKTKEYFPWEKIQTLWINTPFFLRPLGVVLVYGSVFSLKKERADFVLYLSKHQADKITKSIINENIYRLNANRASFFRNKSIVLLSAVLSNGFAGIAIFLFSF